MAPDRAAAVPARARTVMHHSTISLGLKASPTGRFSLPGLRCRARIRDATVVPQGVRRVSGFRSARWDTGEGKSAPVPARYRSESFQQYFVGMDFF
jgi:hypothetical protein